MTGTEISTCLRNHHTPIIIILNNRGYATERKILEGPFHDIHQWHYDKICALIGSGIGHRVETFGAFVQALDSAMADAHHLHILNVILDPKDHSTAITRVARRLAKRLSQPKPALS